MTAPRRRGRPREFDPEQALDAALETFRTHGYSGTSIDDLATAMDLNRPSLYAAFRSKKALYEACIDRYWTRTARRCATALHSTGEVAMDLRAFFTALLDAICGGTTHGCLVACTLPVEVERDPTLRPRLETVLRQSDRAIAARLAGARDAGELGADADPAALAEVVVSVMLALSLRARAGTRRARLEALAETTIGLVLAGAASGTRSRARYPRSGSPRR